MSDLNKMINEWEKSYLNMVRSVTISRKYLFLISLLIPSVVLPILSTDELAHAISLITGLIGVVSVFVFVVNFALIVDDHLESSRNYLNKLVEIVSVIKGREATVKLQDALKTHVKKSVYIRYTLTILVAGFAALLFTTHYVLMILVLFIFNALTAVFLHYSIRTYDSHVKWERDVMKQLKDLVEESSLEVVEPQAIHINPYLMLVSSIISFTLLPVAYVTLRFHSYYGDHISIHRKNHLVLKSYVTKTLRL